eukprot:TRINITY_DN3079_c0_g1_i1.p1 TRINITY_DN3079_c0_g1~~TRINITY_DN3079_c0_g1_i1.p1  ORF type:complete len:484 (+),score=151.68 TRINITY_DN3079_c0_g1_i1:83-1453(+)
MVLAIASCSCHCASGFVPAAPHQSLQRRGLYTTSARSANRGICDKATALRHSTDAAAETDVRLEDRNVPVAHAGLHDFLYGDQEDHGATSKGAAAAGEEFIGNRSYSVTEWLKQYGSSKIAAVYSVIGANGKLAFVGMSRNVAISLQCHLQNEGPNKVALARIQSFRYPKRSEMEALREQWLASAEDVPEGNTPGNEWAQTIKDAASAMAAEQRGSYEEMKLKMRKAIADTSLVDELEAQDLDSETRRANLQASVENDDWSAVINQQTAATITPRPEEVATPQQMTTPQELLGTGAEPLECRALDFTIDNVDKVLDEVRPYLIADGGNCRVVAVDQETRVVSLALQGACGSCPSSTVTMQMGIERVLKENFENLGGVVRVEEDGGGLAQVTADVVESILEPIRPAIKAMNGQVKVVSVFDGVVTLGYSGSPKIKYGIELACKDNPLVHEVKFVDFA